MIVHATAHIDLYIAALSLAITTVFLGSCAIIGSKHRGILIKNWIAVGILVVAVFGAMAIPTNVGFTFTQASGITLSTQKDFVYLLGALGLFLLVIDVMFGVLVKYYTPAKRTSKHE